MKSFYRSVPIIFSSFIASTHHLEQRKQGRQMRMLLARASSAMLLVLAYTCNSHSSGIDEATLSEAALNRKHVYSGSIKEDLRPQPPFDQENLALDPSTFQFTVYRGGDVIGCFSARNGSSYKTYDFHLELTFLDSDDKPIQISQSQRMEISTPVFQIGSLREDYPCDYVVKLPTLDGGLIKQIKGFRLYLIVDSGGTANTFIARSIVWLKEKGTICGLLTVIGGFVIGGVYLSGKDKGQKFRRGKFLHKPQKQRSP